MSAHHRRDGAGVSDPGKPPFTREQILAGAEGLVAEEGCPVKDSLRAMLILEALWRFGPLTTVALAEETDHRAAELGLVLP